MARYDYVYVNKDMNRYSLVRLEGYTTFSENIQIRYPGYKFDEKTRKIVPTTDHKVKLDELLEFLRSKDTDRYESEKDKFFGPSGRYITENS